MKTKIILLLSTISIFIAYAQPVLVNGLVTDGALPVQGAEISIEKLGLKGQSDANGKFQLRVNARESDLQMTVSKRGYLSETLIFTTLERDTVVNVTLTRLGEMIDEVVVSATLHPVSRSNVVAPVEVIHRRLTERISTSQIMDLLPALPGMRVQYSCNVCQAPGLQLNGLPGPYTMLLIDGLPMMGPLSSTYGLFALPTFLMSRVEVSRGPGAVLFGSEAIGGLINIFTPDPDVAPRFHLEQEVTTWGEFSTQAMVAYRKNRWRMLTGVSTHYFNNRVDHNGDGFMDLPLQKRLSTFFKVKYSDSWDGYFRYFYEDRLGGQMIGQHHNRVDGKAYVESIFTNRLEWIMKYTSPKYKPLSVWWSASTHDQNSVYGDEAFLARQYLANAQLLWRETKGFISYTGGAAARYQYYNDNTTATLLYTDDKKEEAPEVFLMPGLFADFNFKKQITGLNAGLRADYHPVHGLIPTYRMGLMVKGGNQSFRVQHGTGFRVVNLFAEEHAALSGAREVVVTSALKPERSIGTSVEWEYAKLNTDYSVRLTTGAFFNVFSNRILPDYDSDPQKIIFDNLSGSFHQAGLNIRCETSIGSHWYLSVGGTVQDLGVMDDEEEEDVIPPFVERYSIQTMTGYNSGRWRLDVSSFTYGPMRLPLAGELDPRPEYSPVFTHLNAQISFIINDRNRLTIGGRNLLDFVPWRGLPFLISRADDPFDSRVVFDNDGNPLPTPDNPYALTFDPEYAFTSLQGRRFFVQWHYSF
ncbi:TonB-dependent receptor [Schleiferia thermophila]|jgi:outer membrane receptor for ferrienterochelin and colicins|uniref:TonB-dependent receptor n=1 Tax=Schleiferia thermophila TaxID=884107 RepID=UPI00055B0FD3|nr:TonB-dependent receptor plug domain-containing protein [Schleiferia thermophila]PMB30553.1 hypothetical protein CEN47_12200 [Fischerella thermalis CCMEE 5319]